MKNYKLTAAAILAAASLSAHAGYIEIGSEVEDYKGSFDAPESFMMPYVGAGFQPFADIPFNVMFTFSDRQNFDEEFVQNNRARQDYGFQYHWAVNDKFTFSPMLIIRHNEYPGSNTSDTEWRIFPNMTYQVNDTFAVALDGFVAPHTQTSKARGNDRIDSEASDRFDYTDYKHELDFQLRTQLNDNAKLTTSLYSEYIKTNDVTLADEQALMNEWQLRVIYQHTFGDFTIAPFARINLHRSFENGTGDEKDQSRNRYGVFGNYKLNNDLSLVYEVYYQTEEQNEYITSEPSDIGDRDYMFYKLAVNYAF